MWKVTASSWVIASTSSEPLRSVSLKSSSMSYAAGSPPGIGRLQHGHQHLLAADRVHLLPDDLRDPLVHAPARRQPRPHPRAHLPDEAGAHHQLVRDRLRVRGRLLLGGQEVFGQAGHRAAIAVSGRPERIGRRSYAPAGRTRSPARAPAALLGARGACSAPRPRGMTEAESGAVARLSRLSGRLTLRTRRRRPAGRPCARGCPARCSRHTGAAPSRARAFPSRIRAGRRLCRRVHLQPARAVFVVALSGVLARAGNPGRRCPWASA